MTAELLRDLARLFAHEAHAEESIREFHRLADIAEAIHRRADEIECRALTEWLAETG
jgi:hypothetical protein